MQNRKVWLSERVWRISCQEARRESGLAGSGNIVLGESNDVPWT